MKDSHLIGGTITDIKGSIWTIKTILGDTEFRKVSKKNVNIDKLQIKTCDECGSKMRDGVCRKCIIERDLRENGE